VRLILLVMTVLIVIVAGISILVSIYNSMSERSHDIAVMRALGASRGAVMAIILVESILLALGGGLIGILLGHGLMGLISPYVVDRTGVTLNWWQFDWQELVLIPGRSCWRRWWVFYQRWRRTAPTWQSRSQADGRLAVEHTGQCA
jgi:putative ABC transport system permease protein